MSPALVQLAGGLLLLIVTAAGGRALLGLGRDLTVARRRDAARREDLRRRLAEACRDHCRGTAGKLAWQGARKFQVDRIVEECAGVRSFYLRPQDRRPLPGFLPGQFLTFEFNVSGRAGKSIRCYSLSDRPRPEFYRITVKRIPASEGQPAGLVSNHLHEQVTVGKILEVKAPAGGFYLDLPAVKAESPIVLIGGGIGITPVLAMLNEIVETASGHETWFLLGVRNRADHPMKEHLEAVARAHPNVRLRVCYSAPSPPDRCGVDFQHEGRITVALMAGLLPLDRAQFYICGPTALMNSITEGLEAAGVAKDRIHSEAFGPASVKRAAPAAEVAAAGPRPMVDFQRTGRRLEWNPAAESLLEFAEAAGVRIESGCRAGNCGTCKVALKDGRVKLLKEPGCAVEPGHCLACISRPETDVTLDA